MNCCQVHIRIVLLQVTFYEVQLQAMAQTTYPSLIPLDEWLTLKETKETCFADAKRKLVGLGWEDRRLGDNVLGWDNNRLGERLPAMLVEKYTRRHRDVMNCHLVGVDKSKFSEDQLRTKICAMESGGPKVVNVASDGGTKLFVSVLSLGPNAVRDTLMERRERPSESSFAASERGVELEVDISGDFHSLRAIKDTLGKQYF